MEIIEKIQIEKGPHFVTVNPKTDSVYVSNYKSNSILIIDDSTKNDLKRIEVSRPGKLVVNQNTNTLYAITDLKLSTHGILDRAKESSQGKVSIIDLSSNKIVSTSDEELGFYDIDVNPSANLIYATLLAEQIITTIDGSTNKEKNQMKVDSPPSSLAVNHLTNKVYVSLQNNRILEFDGLSNNILEQFEVPESGELYLNHQTNMLYLLHREFFEYNEYTTHEYDRLYAIDTNTKNVVKQIPEKKRSWLDKAFREKAKGHNNLAINPNSNRV